MGSLWINDDRIFKEFKKFCARNKLKETACATEAVEKWLNAKKVTLGG